MARVNGKRQEKPQIRQNFLTKTVKTSINMDVGILEENLRYYKVKIHRRNF